MCFAAALQRAAHLNKCRSSWRQHASKQSSGPSAAGDPTAAGVAAGPASATCSAAAACRPSSWTSSSAGTNSRASRRPNISACVGAWPLRGQRGGPSSIAASVPPMTTAAGSARSMATGAPHRLPPQ